MDIYNYFYSRARLRVGVVRKLFLFWLKQLIVFASTVSLVGILLCSHHPVDSTRTFRS